MFEFTDIVSDILLEAEPQSQGTPTGSSPPTGDQTVNNPAFVPPQWLKDIITHHKTLGLSDVTSELDKIIELAFRQIQNRIADKQVESVYDGVRVLDAIERFKKIASPDQVIKGGELGKQLIVDTQHQDIGKKIADEIKTYQNSQQWVPRDPAISEAWGKLLQGQDKMAAVALQTFNNLSVLETVKQIVKRRTNILDRLANFKSLTQPFTNLITDIFKTPEPYSSGAKKVTSDFLNVVDSMYITSIIETAVAAKEFFKADVASKKVNPEQADDQNQTNNQNQQQTQTNNLINPNQEFSDSLNLFDTYINSILVNEVGVLRTAANAIGRGIQQAGKAIGKRGRLAQAGPEVQQRYQQFKEKLKNDQANYDAFLNGKAIQYKVVDPNTGQESSNLGTAGPYTIGVISKIETTEAKNLVNALKKIAQYTRKGIGLGQAVSKTAGALGALRVGMGPVN
jgi:hypothetical protein